MKWYPWLNDPYRQILVRYQQGQGHHALLLHSQQGNGEASLIYALSRWLICRQPNGIKSCGVCNSCRLMKAGNHPDYYQLKPEKGRENLGVDSIRTLVGNLYSRAHQGGVKVVWLAHSEQLTEQAANALLKTLEEPPAQTYFLQGCHEPSYLLPTLMSRCLKWLLKPPEEVLGLRWLQQETTNKLQEATTALRLCDGAPLAAKALLQPPCWQERLALCTAMAQAIVNRDYLILLPLLNKDKNDAPLYWLLSLLTDALKLLQGAENFLVNMDQTKLIIALATHWPAVILHNHLQQWLNYRRQCQINGINQELLLTHYLLKLGVDYQHPCIHH
ncbi:MAG: DNA polymerase III subunit delta' [Sodalis sp. Fse]|nr:MAG: DNA polymerase III subunit delta' [Sodalis sp. Fse]